MVKAVKRRGVSSNGRKPLSASELKKIRGKWEDVEIPEWEGAIVRVAPCSARVSMDFFRRQREAKGLEGSELHESNTENMLMLTQQSIVDEQGELVFGGDDGFEELLELPMSGLLTLQDAIVRVNGWENLEIQTEKQAAEVATDRKND